MSLHIFCKRYIQQRLQSGGVQQFLPGVLGRFFSRLYDLSYSNVLVAVLYFSSWSVFDLTLACAALIWFGVCNFRDRLFQALPMSQRSGQLKTQSGQVPALRLLSYVHPIDRHSDRGNTPVF